MHCFASICFNICFFFAFLQVHAFLPFLYEFWCLIFPFLFPFIFLICWISWGFDLFAASAI